MRISVWSSDGVSADLPQRPRAAGVVDEGPVEFGFGAVEAGVVLSPGPHRHVLAVDAGVGEVDEVVEADLVQRRSDLQRAVVPMQAAFGAVGGFDIELRVAQLDDAGGDVPARSEARLVGKEIVSMGSSRW